MTSVTNLRPSDDMKTVLTNAGDVIEVGIVIGYDANGHLQVFGGGVLDHKQPVAKDWLFMVEAFKHGLLSGDYTGE